MTSRRSNQRNAFGRQTEDKGNERPSSHKFEGRRSANEAKDAAVERSKPGKAQQTNKGNKGPTR
jgi:hypothetical protein